MRNTKQKQIMKEELEKEKNFFSAEEFHKKILNIDSKIGIATVYRFLNEMKKEKKVFSYLCDRKQIYSTNKKSHCHFMCEETGKVIHFNLDSLDFLKNKIPGSIRSFQIEIKGVCKKCNNFNPD